MKGLVLFFIVVFPNFLLAQNFPEPMDPPRMVNDFAGALDQQRAGLLENKLRNYSDSTLNEITVVIIGSTRPYDISEYGGELADQWQIGKASKDNGVLLLVAMDDRSVSISIGYGLEAVITDADSRRLIDKYIVPNFKNGQYFRGIDQTTSILMAMANGEFKIDPKDQERSLGKPFLIVVFIIWLLWNLSRVILRGQKSYGSRHLDALTYLWMSIGLSSRKGRGFNEFSKGTGVFCNGNNAKGSDRDNLGGGGASGSW